MNQTKLSGRLRSRVSVRIFLLAALVLGGTLSATAQRITGSIVGTVNDQQGAVMTGADVTATNTETGFSRSAPTNESGQFRIDFLPVGNYTVAASAPNFKKFVQEKVLLTVDQTLTVSVTLEIGAQSQTVTVTEAPPMVDTSTAVLGRTIEPAEIIGLPLVNRNAYASCRSRRAYRPTAPAQFNPNGTPNFVIGLPSADVQINGSIDGGNPEVSFYLDGGSNITGIRNYGNQLPNPDALEEFRVETSDFSAQYGHMSAAVITAVTKSGTNQFHGSLFEFNRNTDFNAFNGIAEGFEREASRLPTTATTLAVSLADQSSATRRSSSSATRACARLLVQVSGGAYLRRPSAWATSQAICPIQLTKAASSPTTDRLPLR